ncbi:unnamed protein product [Arctogadus glacialis]
MTPSEKHLGLRPVCVCVRACVRDTCVCVVHLVSVFMCAFRTMKQSDDYPNLLVRNFAEIKINFF